jgi:hypothetical protein
MKDLASFSRFEDFIKKNTEFVNCVRFFKCASWTSRRGEFYVCIQISLSPFHFIQYNIWCVRCRSSLSLKAEALGRQNRLLSSVIHNE